MEPLVVRPVHDAHPAGAEAGFDAVLAKRFADHCRLFDRVSCIQTDRSACHGRQIMAEDLTD
jgi:hypothetical protein